jgi:hypothetical protein
MVEVAKVAKVATRDEHYSFHKQAGKLIWGWELAFGYLGNSLYGFSVSEPFSGNLIGSRKNQLQKPTALVNFPVRRRRNS